MKKDLVGIGDFLPEAGVGADGTAFIHGSLWAFFKYEAGTVNRTRKHHSG